MKFRRRNLEALAELVVGNVGRDDPDPDEEPKYFPYRSSSYITEFFDEIGTDYQHDGSTRHRWVADVLEEILDQPYEGPTHPPELFCRLIDHLMSPADAHNEGADRPKALKLLNAVLTKEGFEAFYGDDKNRYLRHTGSNTVTVLAANPHRPFTRAEVERRDLLAAYLDVCSEDDLIEQVLLPLFRQLGYHRITAAGHRDKALEYGKDVWMRYTLPTQHVLYFGFRWASRASSEQAQELLRSRPQTPRYLDGELLRFAERHGVDTRERRRRQTRSPQWVLGRHRLWTDICPTCPNLTSRDYSAQPTKLTAGSAHQP